MTKPKFKSGRAIVEYHEGNDGYVTFYWDKYHTIKYECPMFCRQEDWQVLEEIAKMLYVLLEKKGRKSSER